MTDLFISSQKVLPLLLIIFICVLALFLLARITFVILMFFAHKIYGSQKKSTEPLAQEPKKFIKEDEELLRKLDDIPKAHSETRAGKIGKPLSAEISGKNYELIPSEQQQNEIAEMNKTNIVDIVQPVGFWTSMILGQKLTYLINSAQIINKHSEKGFWVSMIEAQEQAVGRERGRMR